ncbi:hypothetical protein HDU81_005213 [Chytriomyces hyalinus]|nr:hypothetical protein HDU81_005213 [Chytriomyces hyalinus]
MGRGRVRFGGLSRIRIRFVSVAEFEFVSANYLFVAVPANAEKVKYKRPGFWSRFFELNRRMWKVNQGLTGSHPYESRPKDWPFLRRGISFWQASDGQPGQIYLLGNPLVWWTSAVCVLVSALLLGVGMLLVKRNINVLTEALVIRAWNMAQLVVSGWLLHYFPFHLMHRQLFLHHYFPALYFAILSIGLIFDLVTYKMTRRIRLITVSIILGVVFLVFLDFSPLAYGHTMHRHHCERLKWRKDWDWTCLRSPLEEHDILAEIGGKFLNHAADASPVVYSPNPSAVLDAVARIARIEAALHNNGTSPVTGEVSPSR